MSIIQITADINTACTNGLGADFAVAFSGAYSSSDETVATVSDTTITGKAIGNANITGRTLKITQNGLTATGFDGATQTYTVSLSLPLEVTTTGEGIANSTPSTPSTPSPESKPEKIEIKANGEAFDESVEVRLKDDPEVKETIEKALDTVDTNPTTGDNSALPVALIAILSVSAFAIVKKKRE